MEWETSGMKLFWAAVVQTRICGVSNLL